MKRVGRMLILLGILAASLVASPDLWAAPGQNPARQTVPTRTPTPRPQPPTWTPVPPTPIPSPTFTPTATATAPAAVMATATMAAATVTPTATAIHTPAAMATSTVVGPEVLTPLASLPPEGTPSPTPSLRALPGGSWVIGAIFCAGVGLAVLGLIMLLILRERGQK